ncbi:exocyst complex component Sec6-domain-containing protein [Lipomyces tetrasporus]|uniref:Exocyst complex component Sec6-domain-containing protein n=1 Tax=Lipomyces tetrasporus TaxID=54092 RepID=A0AAD7VSM4_9ASCO|nr:exocyst complex component Sec6-domain-containing protein [Lipomyces tetrasporus]KAJ8099879.1 exocyst complex component Sec6-domain-containing protein [Lipomyces tetrasporus]
MGEPAESAISSLADLLRYPDDLAKISSIKERLVRDKAAIDLQLKSGVQTQLDITKNGLKNLLDAKALVGALSSELVNLHIFCAQAEKMVPGFSQINRVSKVRRNFMAVEDVMRNLQELPAKLNQMEALIDADGKDIFGPMTNFLTIHYELSRLRDFRDQAMFQAARSSEDAKRTLQKYFTRLDNVIQEFDDIVFDIAQNLLEVLREGNSSLIVRWAKVIDLEERLDTKVKILKSASESHMELARHLSMSSQPTGMTRALRNYDDRLTECIKLGAKDVFRNCVSTFPDDPSTLLDNLYWVTRDILFAKTDLTKCVPANWKITNRFVAAYHQELYVLFKSLVSKDTEAGLLLKVVRWSQKYNDTLVKELEIPQEQLTPPLLDGQEEEILGDYMRLICRKVDEWMTNLQKTEYNEFIERVQAPDVDPESKYGLANTPIVFQMLNQQINVGIDSDEIRVVAGVIHECKRQLLVRQQKWINVVRDEIQKSNSAMDEVPGGLLEYCIAVANDQVRGADYTENIITRQINVNVDVLVHSDDDRNTQTRMVQELEDAMDGFIATAKSCMLEMVGMVMFDLQPSFANLFKNSWYTSPVTTTAPDGTITSTPASLVIQEVVRTFEEYNSELTEHFNPDLFQIYIDDLLEATLVSYLSAISKNKGASLSARSLDQIKSDVAIMYPFFTTFTDSEHVESQFNGIEIFMGLASSDKIGAIEGFRALKENFPDAPLKFVEDVLRAREDLDSKSVKEYMEAVRSECASLIMNPTTDRRTYMSRLYI